MTQHSRKCKDAWIETDIVAINLAIELAIDTKILTIDEFTYIVCPVCPYLCNSCSFCWESYTQFRYENCGQNYKNIMKLLIKAFYNKTNVDTFNFFRTKICKMCKKKCKQVYLGTPCTENYLNQMKNEIPGYNKKTNYLTPKKAILPMVSVSGDTMLKIINKLWKQNDKTDSEEWTYTPKN